MSAAQDDEIGCGPLDVARERKRRQPDEDTASAPDSEARSVSSRSRKARVIFSFERADPRVRRPLQCTNVFVKTSMT